MGACIGEAFFERGFGKKAMWWGALAQSIPDIDFVASFWLSASEAMLAHRGFTHSLLFLTIIVPLMTMAAYILHKPIKITFYKWLLFFTIEVAAHLFLDGFNNYGIGWFEPFSHSRFSFNVIYVADPFFSIPIVISFLMLALLNRYSQKRTKWWRAGIVIPFVYLSYCTFNKLIVTQKVKRELSVGKIHHTQYLVTPAPLQNWLWYIVVGDSAGFNIAYCSVFDKKKPIEFYYHHKNDYLLNNISDHENLQRLIRFSQGYYTISKKNDTLIFNDLRFGQVNGWSNHQNNFVFNYKLDHSINERLMIQKGRFSGLTISSILSLFKRAAGNQSFLLK